MKTADNILWGILCISFGLIILWMNVMWLELLVTNYWYVLLGVFVVPLDMMFLAMLRDFKR